MGKIILIDDRPIMAFNLAKEWAEYYNNVWREKVCPIFYIITLYDKKKIPDDWKKQGMLVDRQLKELNNGRSKYFHQIILEEEEDEAREEEIENKINEFVEAKGKKDSLLVALDLHLFDGDGEKIKRNQTIVSMNIFELLKEQHRNVLLYTSFSDEKQLAYFWKQVYENNRNKKANFVYARENALNYNVLVESAKELLNGVLKNERGRSGKKNK